MSKQKYDSSVARIAGNIASGMMEGWLQWPSYDSGTTRVVIVQDSVAMARAIVAEVQRTEPVEAPTCGENIAGTKLFCTLVLDHVGPCDHPMRVSR